MRYFVASTVLVTTLILLLMANSVFFSRRIDLTESRVHTLSPVTRDLLGALEHELSITYYLSDRLSRQFPQPREIVDLLEEYEAISRGRVRTRIADPASLDRPEEVEEVGVVPQQLQVTEDGEQRFAIVYSGIVIEYLDRREVVPFVFEATNLEYDLTTAARDLVRDDARDLAFVLGNRGETLEADYRLVASELSRSYDVRSIAPGEPIPDDVDVALVVDSQRLDTTALAAVSDYLSRGGSVFLTVERMEVDLSVGLEPVYRESAPVYSLLERFGIRVGESILLDESHNQIRVEEVGGQFRVARAYPYPHWPVTLEQFTAKEHPVTARHAGLDLYWPAWLDVAEGIAEDRLEVETIVASTPRAWLMREPVVLNPQEEQRLRRDADGTTGQYGLVAVARSGEPGAPRLGVVADSDFLRDTLVQASGSAHNLTFVENMAQWLSNDVDLLEIRTRGSRQLGLNAIEEPQRERTVEFMARAVNLVLVPAAVVLAGLVRHRGRRRRSRRSEEVV